MIKTENVYFEYRAQSEENSAVRAIDGISLDIDQGNFIAILGRNGSGKSTLARLMNALLIPQQGTVVVDGMDTKNGELVWEVRKTLGLVFQNPDNQLVATTVEEDVAFGPENLGVPPDEMRTRVDNSIRLVGLKGYAGHSPHMLSGGQKQRVAIAGILAMEPKCIVLDEATSMLDPAGRKEVLDVLHRLNKNRGITIILITHHMDEAVEADFVFIMQKGRIILNGKPGEIFKNVELIRNAGLDVPQVTALAHILMDKGYPVSELPITLDEMVRVLKNLIGSKGYRNGYRMDTALSPQNKPDKDGTAGQGKITRQNDKIGKDEKNRPVIVAEDVSYVYMPGTTYEKTAIRDINLSISRGEILGIIGQTGSGKSTLVQHFNGILRPTYGKLYVDGTLVTKKEIKELRKKVGLIFQYPEQQLFEETVYKDIAYGLTKMGIPEKEIRRRVFHVTDVLGISPELLEKSPFELSGGQKRRAAIAGVLAMKPEVVILDEPTAGLDPQGSHEVFKILSELNRNEGMTIVIISHNMDDIAAFCDRVAVMNDGGLVMCDTTRRIFSKAEELKSYGLDIPKITELFGRMKQEGYPFPTPVLTVNEAADVIDRSMGGGRYE